MSLRNSVLVCVSLVGLSGCQPPALGPVAPLAVLPAAAPQAPASGVVRVTPSFVDGRTGDAASARRLMAEVLPNTQATINHMVVALYTLDGGSETLVAQTDLAAADLLAPVTFGNLKNNQTYRVRAFAYRTAGTGDPISIDASSFVDIPVGTDNAPALGNLVVTLTDVTFSGSATSSGLTVTPGTLTHSGSETVTVNINP